MLRLIACVPGTTHDRWLRQTLSARAILDGVPPEALAAALELHGYAGALILLDHPVIRQWATVRRGLITGRIPTILLAPLSAEVLHAVAFERELQVVALHVLGIDDSPTLLKHSLEQLLGRDPLDRLLNHFGRHSSDLHSLILPVWTTLSQVPSLEAWAVLVHRTSGCLVRELRARRVRSPRRLLVWLRLLSGLRKLHEGETASRVAFEVGYSAPPAFSRSTRQLLGMPPLAACAMPIDLVIARAAADLVA